MLRNAYRFLRLTKPASLFLGPKYSRSRCRIEIDVTYACDLKCLNCDRSCRQAPSKESMTVGQVEKFVGESAKRGVMWEHIRVLGGEPTLHPQIEGILDALLLYKRENSPSTRIVLVTNGFGRRASEVLKRIPQGVEIENSGKKTGVQEFEPFNMAPQDSVLGTLFDYSLGCQIPEHCGMGLTPYGYYPCAVSGGIDRIFGFNLGRKSLPAEGDDMRDLMRVFCRLCGHYTRFMNTTMEEEVSSTWRKAYERYGIKNPEIPRY